ncbi:zinc finger protein 574 [Trichomycterus rosablanca]|uniref:zinc finger protein 574 n=1 Tax=Trichomycterus rosablanca TaxID=2290929 RepID=UPI002F359CD4
MENSSVYMCFPCYQEFPSLEEVLAHQLTCTAENPQSLQSATPVEAAAISAGISQVVAQSVDVSEVQTKPLSSSDVPRVLYQCADCDTLFDALSLWQQHRKIGCSIETELEPEPGHDPELQGVTAEWVPQTTDQLAVNHVQLERQVKQELDVETLQTEAPTEEVTEVPQQSSAKPTESTEPTEQTEAVQEPTTPVRKRGQKKAKPPSSLLCVECGHGFSVASELVAHRRTAHGLKEAIHRCGVCGESFLNTTLFLYHRKQHRTQTQEEEQKELEVPQISTSLLEAPGEGLLLLATAGEGVMQIASLEQTVSEAVSLAQVEVELTPDVMREAMVQQSTEIQETVDEGIFSMEIQDVKVVEEASTDTAQEEPSDSQSFLCSQCGCSFSIEQQLALHRSTAHGLASALHTCTECGMEFMNTTQFLYHRREHGKSVPSPARPNPALGHLSKPRDGGLLRRPEISTDGSNPLPDAALEATAKLSRDWSRTSLPHECPHCGQGFTRRNLLREHVFQHTGEKLFSCNICHKSFPSPASLLRHSLCHGAPRSFTCPVCNKAFSQPASLKRHMLIHDEGSVERRGRGRGRGRGRSQLDTRLHSCPECPASFKLDSQLQMHRLLHTSHPFPCDECGKAFKRRKELDLHSLMHQDKEPVTCEQCGSQFLNQSVLDVHMQRCTGEPPQRRRYKGHGRGRVGGQLECDMCGHRCVTQDGLDLHRLSHTGQTPLRCPLTPCRKRFASSSALAQHVVVHCRAPLSKRNAPRRFTCEYCAKEFSYASTFAVHMRTHTDERPFECTVCGKRFRQLPHLQDHERIHSGERPFVCWVCGKSFSVAARLAEHARVHSGERPFACPHCPTAFRSRPNLQKHLRFHSGDTNNPAPEIFAVDQDSAVQTILLVQEAGSPSQSSGTAVPIIQEGTLVADQHGGSVVFLHPNMAMPTVGMPAISVVAGQEVPHTIEFIIEETV